MRTKTLTHGVRWSLALILALSVWLLSVGIVTAGSPVGTGFTYQGFLKDGNSPANDAYDFEFRLFDAPTDGIQVGSLVAHNDVTVTNGLFVVQLDFGAEVFNGEARWLEIGVSAGRATISPTVLAPRQALTPAPYALHATSTGALQGYPVTGTAPLDGQALVWSQGEWQAQTITSTVGVTAGTGLTLNTELMSLLPAYQLPQMCDNGQVAKWNSSTWECAADSDTMYTAGLGLHLTANQFVVASDTVQARVSGTCGAGYAMRTVNQDGTVVCEPIPVAFSGWALTGNSGTNPAADFIGTTDDVTFTVRVSNTTALQFIPNAASPNLIGGYGGNWVTNGVFGATIGGGGQSGDLFNRVTDHWGVIGGGQNNQVGNDDADPNNTRFATIGGGGYNTASGGSATVSGGWGNMASGADSTIGGGSMNTASGSYYATISGGRENTASGESSAIGGGHSNTASGVKSFVGGGYNNTVTGTYASIVGGGYNTVTSTYASIVGGRDNTVTGTYAIIVGGQYNTASGSSAIVSGGHHNTASGESSDVSGGHYNTASGPAATVSGGGGNTAAGDYSFVAGRDNTANGASATVSGGYFNTADGDYSFVAGGFYANASHYGEQAHAGGQFAAAGDAQASDYVLRRAAMMPAGAWHDLYLDGNSASQQITIAPGRTVTFDILISGRTEAGESAGYRIEGLIENVGGTTMLVGTPTITTIGEDDTDWNVQVLANDTLDALLPQVWGNGEMIRWVARVTTAEVSW